MRHKTLTVAEMDKTIQDYYLLKMLVLGVLDWPDNDFESQILKAYIKIQSTTEIADKLNKKGLKIKTENELRYGLRKYVSTDIRDIILKSKKGRLTEVAKAFLSYNKGRTNFQSLLRLAKL